MRLYLRANIPPFPFIEIQVKLKKLVKFIHSETALMLKRSMLSESPSKLPGHDRQLLLFQSSRLHLNQQSFSSLLNCIVGMDILNINEPNSGILNFLQQN